MNDLISRQMLIDVVKELPSITPEPSEEWRKQHYENSYNQGFLDGYKMCEDKWKKGKWINTDDYAICSICKLPTSKIRIESTGKYIPYKTNFCPNCGADMRK